MFPQWGGGNGENENIFKTLDANGLDGLISNWTQFINDYEEFPSVNGAYVDDGDKWGDISRENYYLYRYYHDYDYSFINY